MTEILLNVDVTNLSTLYNILITGAGGVITTLYFAAVKAKNEQIKEKDTTLLQIVAAKDENINSKDKLLADFKKENEALQQQNIQLLAQVLPVLKVTQEVVKEISQVLREISKK